jgi:DNA (cytosine-5)-methyltransferase 1
MPTDKGARERPRLLDLFCGAGGCSAGYERAGFEVTGVDIRAQPHYPFLFIQRDARSILRRLDLDRFAAIHASPPCQAYTKARKLQGNEHEDLITETRELLIATGLPYVIENVKGAPLRDPFMLEGQMFEGLNVHRPRLFETNWWVEVPTLIPPPPRQTKMGRPPVPGEAMQIVGHFSDVPAGRAAMGIDWMTQGELAQAIPPAYTEYIGRQLLDHIYNPLDRLPDPEASWALRNTSA